jgi:DNA-directed RNA polymerase subunit beta
MIDKLFFSDQRYSLGHVGRFRINSRLKLDIPEDKMVLTKEDIVCIITNLISLVNSKVDVDDIDHLSNRRVRTVGEQLSNQFSVGLSRMARTIRERMNVRDNEVFTPIDLINAKTLSAVINSFFGTSQLSQFMDQTNPLAEVTHKRRISALGPGGLTRERAGFEVRDVHYTHYGRLCPIETPEGPNIGLISSLAVFAKINTLGFIETPYRNVVEGKINLDEAPVYKTAEQEIDGVIAQANASLNEDGSFENDRVQSRSEADYLIAEPSKVTLMDVAPNQIASIAASLIPFLEHDDANRALMGSNMMRQAVPLLRTDAPIVGTGIEPHVARDSRTMINAEGEGKVTYVDANTIKVKYTKTQIEELISFDDSEKTYELTKFQKTNQRTCINIQPLVRVGDKVIKGQVLCHGYATENGELAIGRNLKVAFMPWKGYNFEDAIILSERVVREDLFTSLHIVEHVINVRETTRGLEELTADIPNISETATKDLDEYGMVRVGAHVKHGDILIGKITPKGESDPTPEEKLLRAIFGEKAGDVKDASLKTKPADAGVIIGKSLFSKTIKDRRAKTTDKESLVKLDTLFDKDAYTLKNILASKLYQIIGGKASKGVKNILGEEVIPKSAKFTKKMLLSIDFTLVDPYNWTASKENNTLVNKTIENYLRKYNDIYGEYRRGRFAITIGDELPNGVLQLAKVQIAQKRKVKVGDKLAGRHGNKGIVSRIVKDEDMPFLEDGTPVDIILNPLGVPSRMNLGQIYETILGWAGQELGKKYFTPVFDGASIDQINTETDQAGLPRLGQTYLFDGGTGERFEQTATVGIIYMLKLSHLIDDKMHARSIGPYSLITQQPLGGKAQFGGQRLGEMEVWALEGYGASNILQEMLTLKSDDVLGRAKAFEAMVKGKELPKAGIPESFNVLLHELNGLGLKVTFE